MPTIPKANPAVVAEHAARIMQRCDELAAFSEEPRRLTRRFLSPPFHATHREVRRWMEEAGLRVDVDAVGNIVGKRESAAPGAKIFAIGSHLDTVPGAGKFDGMLGVLVGIAAAEILAQEELPYHFEVVGFTAEEGVRFHTPFLGSRAYVGTFDESLLAIRDDDGQPMGEMMKAFGLDLTRISDAARTRQEMLGFLEIHIEQGPELEASKMPIAVVDNISGQTRLTCGFEGKARHAGTTSMHLRKDALAGAAEMVLVAERAGREGRANVVTVGRLVVEPNASNCVAGSARFTLDVRHPDDTRRGNAVAFLLEEAQRIGRERGLDFVVDDRKDTPTVYCDGDLTNRILHDAVTETLGDSGIFGDALHHHSGAGHDAMIVAGIAPVAMLFVRCFDGISHHPDENVTKSDVAISLAATVNFLRRLAAREI